VNYVSKNKNLAGDIIDGLRISSEVALELYNSYSLSELGYLAHLRREQTLPGRTVTYLIDRNINYTNVCNTDCTFCGFYRPSSDHPESYVLSKDTIRAKIKEALELGATRILLQGGHNDALGFGYYLDLVSWLNSNFEIELNCFSPSEIHQMKLVSGKSYFEILSELKEAGMRGLPGGGAEILDDQVRKRISPKKIGADLWIEIMEVAHELTLTTTCTMVIGCGESFQNRINHLERLRNCQDKAMQKGLEGFNGFISWTLQHNENTSIGRSRFSDNFGTDSTDYLKNVAVARMYLDNIKHHQASWPALGAEIGKIALHFGCDDFGSTMMEENVVSVAGGPSSKKWAMGPEELRMHISNAGFIPSQRNTSYEILTSSPP